MNESSSCSTKAPEFGVFSDLDFGHSNRCVVIFNCCFNLHSPVTYDVEPLFIGLFAICVSSLVRYQLRSLAHF